MNGILITGMGLLGAIVSPSRSAVFFKNVGRMGLDAQKVTIQRGASGIVWLDTGSDVLRALVVDNLDDGGSL